MSLAELFLIGVGLSMDAFAVSVCRGLSMRKINYRHAVIIALFFGGFQAIMPLAGWLLGSQFARLIEQIDHWIAFVLLGVLGVRMIWEALHDAEAEEDALEERFDLRQLFLMAVATSIDALAVGITLAFLRVNIAMAATTIGITTFVLSFAGVLLGHRFGSRWKNKAELAGGVALVLIGLKILVEHLSAGGGL